MTSFQDILNYFLNPTEFQGYDLPKTLAYGVVFIFAVYAVFLLLKKLKIEIDWKLYLSVSPYIILGGILRVMQDAGLINSYWFVTPGIYFFVFSICFSSIVISKKVLEKSGVEYYKVSFLFGMILVSFSFPFLRSFNFMNASIVLFYFLPLLAIFYRFEKWSVENRIVTLLQMFDAITTFVAVSYFGLSSFTSGFVELHFFPNFLINTFGPFSFVVVKFFAIVSILLIIDRYSKDVEFNRYLKFIIAILGAATGTRDFLAILSLT